MSEVLVNKSCIVWDAVDAEVFLDNEQFWVIFVLVKQWLLVRCRELRVDLHPVLSLSKIETTDDH